MVESLLGLFEISELANVSPSAVINWRKRFSDFPQPLAELKSGPVFSEAAVKVWLANRHVDQSAPAQERFYDRLAGKRGDSLELRTKIAEVVDNLEKQATSVGRPGVLLGGVQSGKTRAFLGVIASAFDRQFDVAVILTKGTKSLAEQTLSRVKNDFRDFIASDQVEVFDILAVPKLTQYELTHKLVFVVKKEDDNLRRLLTLINSTYPILKSRTVLVIDDEADLASVSFRKADGITSPGVISKAIDSLRSSVSRAAFLQVTATPYALYLQPEDEAPPKTNLFWPKRPAFTVVLPTHEKYVGGSEYFEKSAEQDSPAAFFYREVPIAERDALKKEDRRRLQIGSVLTEKNAAVLRDAVVTFVVGGMIRRLQQRAAGHVPQKYSFLCHTEQSRESHEWQERVVRAIHDSLVEQSAQDSPLFNDIVRRAYTDLRRSVELIGSVPAYELVHGAVREAFHGGYLMITKVNSDNDIKQLLADDGQLKLRTPFNIFIGGQILDRGITINNLIGFYYGRNPKRFQQDTVLQHSRMYGARSSADVSVTRFYAPLHVYQVMKRIHEFDAALRQAFESGDHAGGVYFIQKDSAKNLVPCSPNKLLFSDVVSVRPGRRLVLSGFDTVSRSQGIRALRQLDDRVDALTGGTEDPVLIDKNDAIDLLTRAFAALDFEEADDDDRNAHLAALEHLSQTSKNVRLRNKVWLLAAKDRNVARYREEGRFSNAPDTKQQKDLARERADDIPVLMMLRQNGKEEQGWRGLPFWWPVIVTPRTALTAVFASTEAVRPTDSTRGPRPLPTEQVE